MLNRNEISKDFQQNDDGKMFGNVFTPSIA